MYEVSSEYKEQIEKSLRNPSYIRITLGVYEPEAPNESEITDNGHLYFSDVSAIDDIDIDVSESYGTLETNRLVLDGNTPLPIEIDYINQGYVNEELSDENGNFATNPLVSINFNSYFEFSGLTITFDKSTGDFPSQIQIICKNDDEEVFNSIQEPDNFEYLLEEHIPSCNSMEIIFIGTNIPQRRARITSLVYGLIKTFANEDIASCELMQESDVISSELPQNDFTFTIFDIERLYDPENPSGIWEYLEAKQPVKFEIGYELDNGSIEWQQCANNLTTGDVSVERTGIATEVKIQAKALLAHLTQTFDEAIYYSDGITLKALAESIMIFAGYTTDDIILDETLAEITTLIPLEIMPCNEALQLIANAGRCVMSISREGKTQILRPTEEIQDFQMDFSKLTEAPKITKIPILRNLITYYQQVSVSETAESVVTDSEVKEADNTNIEFTHDPITEHSVTVGEGLTLNSSLFYANKTVLNLTGEGKVSITGKIINTSSTKYVKHCNDVGEDLEISNPLISDLENAKAFADWVAKAMLRRNTYEVPDRGYPEIDVNDNISITTNNENIVDVTVLKRVTEFNGTINGQGKYLIGNNS